jgi:hypothetical protein
MLSMRRQICPARRFFRGGVCTVREVYLCGGQHFLAWYNATPNNAPAQPAIAVRTQSCSNSLRMAIKTPKETMHTATVMIAPLVLRGLSEWFVMAVGDSIPMEANV